MGKNRNQSNNGKQQPYEDIYIRFVTEQEYRAVELVKFDTNLDLAVLQMKTLDDSFTKITPGNSGGALLDGKGRIIGITPFELKRMMNIILL